VRGFQSDWFLWPPEARHPSSPLDAQSNLRLRPESRPHEESKRDEKYEPALCSVGAVKEYLRYSLTTGRQSNCASCEARPAKETFHKMIFEEIIFMKISARRGAHSEAAAPASALSSEPKNKSVKQQPRHIASAAQNNERASF